MAMKTTLIKIMLQHIFIIFIFFVSTFWIFISIKAKQFEWTYSFIPNENAVSSSFFFIFFSSSKRGKI